MSNVSPRAALNVALYVALAASLAAPAAAAPLSDRTGLVSQLDLGPGLEGRIVGNFDVTGYGLEGGVLEVRISSGLNSSLGEIVLPAGLAGEDPAFTLDGRAIEPDVKSNGEVVFATLEFMGAGEHVLAVGSAGAGAGAPAGAPDPGDPGYLWWAIAGAAASAGAVGWILQRRR
ncbi:MAG: hypothetical protein MPJ04_07290 [Nitrosopumilus sp.]|nr:hypothetical protein [Nitrosopumilus sp.]MDA7996886.1 hypothetical protein [Nitrosopumilus sp.]